MNITLISPNIVSQKGDVAGTGIPYVPISLVYLATYLRSLGHKIKFIDTFSENPFVVRESKGFLFQGISPKQALARIEKNTELIILYAAQVYAHRSLLEILKEAKKLKKTTLIVENTQAVTAYSLRHAYKDFFSAGIDYVLSGEAEPRIEAFIDMLNGRKMPEEVDGLIYMRNGKVAMNPKVIFENPERLPFPDWEFVNIENYWKLGYAHAPLETGKYLPILTSRGCPQLCNFCVVPATNEFKWRPRSARNVVQEIEQNMKKYNVREFHIEDLNPTIDRTRIEAICRLILKKKLDLILKYAAGTKAETYDLGTIRWMAKAGFDYISISPESGSPRVLRLMKKYFNHAQALGQVRLMHDLGITSQACIVLGYPGEEEADLRMTRKYVAKLTRAGLDEVALFIMTPVPGSKAFDLVAPKYGDISQLTFTPKWRPEYRNLVKWRMRIMLTFMLNKIFFHPFRTLGNVAHFFSGHFRTKWEMTVYRVLKTHFFIRKVNA